MRWLPTLTPRRLRQLWYAPLLALAMGLMMLRLLVMAQLLDVQAFAEFSGGILVSSSFCMFGCLGLQSMLQREWPVQIVRCQELRAAVRAMQCHLISTACVVAGLAAAAAGWAPAGMSAALMAVGLLHGLAQQSFLVATGESRSRGDALRFACQNLVRAGAAFVLSVAVAAATGSALAALIVDALATLIFAAAYFAQALARVRLGARAIGLLACRRMRQVRWRSALALMMIMVTGFVVLNADRWVASARLSVAGFAHYSLAWIVLSVAQSTQVVINAALYPMAARRFAEHGRAAAFRVCLLASGAVLLAGALLAVPLALLLAYGIERWYLSYLDALVLLPWFLAIAVLRVSDFWSSFLLICGFEFRLLRVNLAVAFVGIVGWLAWTRPWVDPSASLQQVAALAMLLTALGYFSTAAAAWRLRSS